MKKATKDESLISGDVTILVKTRFIDKEEEVPSTALTVILESHSLELDLSLPPDDLRRVAAFITNSAQWIEDQRGKPPAKKSSPEKKASNTQGTHLRLL